MLGFCAFLVEKRIFRKVWSKICILYYSTNQPKVKCVLRVTRTSLKQKMQLHAKVVRLRVFACANSSTAVRILDELRSYTNHYRVAY